MRDKEETGQPSIYEFLAFLLLYLIIFFFLILNREVVIQIWLTDAIDGSLVSNHKSAIANLIDAILVCFLGNMIKQ